MRKACLGSGVVSSFWRSYALAVVSLTLGVAGCGTKGNDMANGGTSANSGGATSNTGGKNSTDGMGTGGMTDTSATGGAGAGSGGSGAPKTGGSNASGGDGATGGAPGSASDGAVVEPDTTVFRITTLAFRDPHMVLGTTDITDTPLLGVSVNGSMIESGFTMDYDGDGFVDSSFLMFLTPSSTGLEGGRLQMIDGLCDLADPTKCQPDPTPSLDGTWSLHESADQVCLEAIADSTSGYSPPVAATEAPCFAGTESRSLAVNVGGIIVEITDARVAARLENGSPSRLTHGLLMGFVTETAAANAVVPAYIPLLAGSPLSNYIPAADYDPDTKPGSENGFWLYMNFEADTVDYQVP